MFESETLKGDKKGSDLQFIIFNLADQEYGINILDSREIVTFDQLTVIPDSPEFVSGVINLRDNIIPIIDLTKKFNLKESSVQMEKIIIILVNNNLIGLAVKDVKEILRINSDDISDPPEITKNIDKNYVEGIARLDERLLILLDVESIFSKKEIKQIEDMDT